MVQDDREYARQQTKAYLCDIKFELIRYIPSVAKSPQIMKKKSKKNFDGISR
jgi:hypothetical protein